MPNDDPIEKIRQRLRENAYFLNPHSDANVREDVAWLLGELDRKDQDIAKLKKKAEVLAQQVMELTQEIENVRSDFDSHR